MSVRFCRSGYFWTPTCDICGRTTFRVAVIQVCLEEGLTNYCSPHRNDKLLKLHVLKLVSAQTFKIGIHPEAFLGTLDQMSSDV